MQNDSSNQPNSKQEMSKEDSQALYQAKCLLELQECKGWEYLKGYLLELAQSKYPNPKDYQSNEKLILDYTRAFGGTELVKELFTFLSEQEGVAKIIETKKQTKESFAI